MSTWDHLREMKLRGQFPKLVIVTNERDMPLRDIGGAFTIDHDPAQAMPVHLLEDLRVVFWFHECSQAQQAAKAIQSQRIRVKSACVTCHCAGAFNPAPYPSCEAARRLTDWADVGS